LKATDHALVGKPGTREEDQKDVEGVAGKALGSTKAPLDRE
jgi:hypothetical protein